MNTLAPRELIMFRRAEANICILSGLHQAATLTACSGIEMLLKTLFDELIEKLRSDSNPLAKELQDYRQEMTADSEKANEWGLGRWIKFYSDYGLINELSQHFNYSFSKFKLTTLWKTNAEWNECKHGFSQVSFTTANAVCNSLNAFLEETRYPLSDDIRQPTTMAEISRSWRQQWQMSIERWVVKNRTAPQADILLPLPDLLSLVVNLISDERTPIAHKTYLMIAANYVISSVDLMPEEDLDVRGLVDDSAVLVLTLSWLLHHQDLERETLVNNWTGNNDIVAQIERLGAYIRINNEVLFVEHRLRFGDRMVWNTIRKISSEGPEALWKNYWKEAY